MAQETEQMTAKGLDKAMEGCAVVCEGVREHLRAMEHRTDLEAKLNDCIEMCREIGNELRR